MSVLCKLFRVPVFLPCVVRQAILCFLVLFIVLATCFCIACSQRNKLATARSSFCTRIRKKDREIKCNGGRICISLQCSGEAEEARAKARPGEGSHSRLMVTHTVVDRSWSALCGLAPLALMELQVELNEVMRFLPLGRNKDLICTLPKLHLVGIHQQLEMEQEEEERSC